MTCACGCGQETQLATVKRRGNVIGEPCRYLPGHSGRPLSERLFSRLVIDPETGCWNWPGALSAAGYGQIGHQRRVVYTHRTSYELLRGPIPDGLVIDHLCRNTRCANPDHLEPVTQGENVLRGESPMAKQARQVVCKNNHPFDADNTLINNRGQRRCRTCLKAYNRARAEARP